MHSEGFGAIEIQWMQIFEESIERVGGVELLEEIVNERLRGPGGVSFRNIHYQGVGRIIFQWMQIFDENTRRVGGLNCL